MELTYMKKNNKVFNACSRFLILYRSSLVSLITKKYELMNKSDVEETNSGFLRYFSYEHLEFFKKFILIQVWTAPFKSQIK